MDNQIILKSPYNLCRWSVNNKNLFKLCVQYDIVRTHFYILKGCQQTIFASFTII